MRSFKYPVSAIFVKKRFRLGILRVLAIFPVRFFRNKVLRQNFNIICKDSPCKKILKNFHFFLDKYYGP
jgi:hypothetical protein